VQTELAAGIDAAVLASLGGWEQFALVVKSPAQGAATQVWAAVTPYFDDVAYGGVYLSDVGVAGPEIEGETLGGPGYAGFAYDEEAEERLWELSCGAVGVEM
jgi:hypothetical protein